MSENNTLIEVKNVSKKYCRNLRQSMRYAASDILGDVLNRSISSENLRENEFWALKAINFSVERGECLGLIGPNGAGKSTLLKLINGIFLPDIGTITVKGRMGALIAVGAGFHPLLTGRENILVNGLIMGLTKQEIQKRFEEIVAFSGLGDVLDSPIKTYSSGMYIRLGFSIAACAEPDVLLVDEALAVGDALFRFRCIERIQELRTKGTVIVYVSHDLKSLNSICDTGITIVNGQAQEKMPIGDALAYYESLIRNWQLHELRSIQLDTESRRYFGNRRSGKRENLSISAVRLLDENRVEATRFHVGQKIVLELDIENTKRPLTAGVSFYIEDASGTRIVGWSSFEKGHRYRSTKGQKATFRMTLTNIFRPSMYSISVTAIYLLTDASIKSVVADDQIDKAILFESIEHPDFPVWSLVYSEVDYSVTDAFHVEGNI